MRHLWIVCACSAHSLVQLFVIVAAVNTQQLGRAWKGSVPWAFSLLHVSLRGQQAGYASCLCCVTLNVLRLLGSQGVACLPVLEFHCL